MAKVTRSSQDQTRQSSSQTASQSKTSKNSKTRIELPACRSIRSQYCYICSNYIRKKSRSAFNTALQEKYRELYNVSNIKNSGYQFAGSSVCSTCRTSLKHQNARFRPAIWNAPRSDHSDCYVCNLATILPCQILQKYSQKRSFKYPTELSVQRPDRSAKGEQLNDEDSDTDELMLEPVERSEENEDYFST